MRQPGLWIRLQHLQAHDTEALFGAGSGIGIIGLKAQIMLVTIDTSFIPSTPFKVLARKNATNVFSRKCPVPDPPWLTNLLASEFVLQLENVLVQAGRHFSDKVNGDIFGPCTTNRQAATAIAWTIISLVQPSVSAGRLLVHDPLDSDIKRLCSEIIGVGMALELVRKRKVIDGRTIQKRAKEFDYEASRPGGSGRVLIEAKGTFNDASSSEHRRSIAAKINGLKLPRGYDSAIGIIASIWSEGSVRTFDVEICDPEREPEEHFRTTVRDVIRFYARRFDEAVGIEAGTRLLFTLAEDANLFDERSGPILSEADRDPRPFGALYHNRLSIRRGDLVQEFWGRLWEPRKLPIPLMLENVKDAGKVHAFMGIDSAIFRLIQERDFTALLSYSTDDEGLWRAAGEGYNAIFNVDSYGVIRGLFEGDLPMQINSL
jgi:hypothetical protein